jgi:NADH-quinone oxidoreductase subunit G
VILVGERLATSPGALSAAAALAAKTGAKLAWVPRRAGERGAVDAGALPNLLPGGRTSGEDLGWGELPTTEGKDLTAILTAIKAGELKALLIGAVDPADCPDPTLALDAIEKAEFVVSLEIRRSPVTDRADVVFPVASAVEKDGTFLDWEGRARPFEAVLRTSGALADLRVIHLLSEELGRSIELPDVSAARAELGGLSQPASRPEAPAVAPAAAAEGTVLATWHWLLDDGSLQDGEPHLAGTAKAPRLHLSASTAAGLGAAEGDPVTVSTDAGSLTLPLVIADLPDDVVWVPTRTRDAHVRTDLAAAHGSVVTLAKGGAA